MADTLNPPPPPIPPYGGPEGTPWPAPAYPPPAQKRTASEIAAYATVACGLLILIAIAMPAMHFNSGDIMSSYSMADTPDAVFFALIGLGVAALGVMRIYRDHIAVRIIIGLVAAYSIWIVTQDVNAVTALFLNKYEGYAITMTWGPAPIMIAAASALAIAAACAGPKTGAAPSGPSHN